jgi:hypothetical protein
MKWVGKNGQERKWGNNLGGVRKEEAFFCILNDLEGSLIGMG